jgi:hypothetical protein
MMMRRIIAVLAVLYAGRQLAHPERWKNLQLWGSLLIALAAVADAFGFGFGLAPDLISALVVALGGAGNALVTVATTDKIGLPADPPGSEERP